MRVIDAHVHLYPPEAGREPIAWAEANREAHWAKLCTRRRKNGQWVQGFPTVDQLLRDMDSAGIAKVVLLGWYWENHATCLWQNEFYAQCICAHPDRAAAFATVHPSAGDAAAEELRRAKDRGFIGLGELSPHSQGVTLTDPGWIQLMRVAEELKLPVNLHVTDSTKAPYPGRVETPLMDFVRLAWEFPKIKFILAHWGGGLAFEKECRALRNVYYDTAASPLTYGPEAWTRASAAGNADRVLFGSDYPLVLYPKNETAPGFGAILEEVTSAGLSEAHVKAMIGSNAERLLNIK